MDFALITEGVSEHRIIRHIVNKIFKEDDELSINQIQPEVNDDKQLTKSGEPSEGGWHRVLIRCEQEDIEDIFIENDYLIIQIDSDYSETSPFDVPHTKTGGVSKEASELHSDIVDRINKCFSPGVLPKFSDRIIFAICIDSIECWLIPVVCEDHNCKKRRHCLVGLNDQLRKKNMKLISTDDKNSGNSIIAYDKLLTNLKGKKINHVSKHQHTFELFVNSLKEKLKKYRETILQSSDTVQPTSNGS